jgi:transposase
MHLASNWSNQSRPWREFLRKAVTATARKIAVLFYKTLRYGAPYKDPGADYYEERFRRRTLENLRRRADALGFKLVESEPAVEGVS